MSESIQQGKNTLFPVFLKLEQLQVLLIGGGITALEKLKAILANSPATGINVVAPEICGEIRKIAESFPTIRLITDSYQPQQLDACDLVITAVNNFELSRTIREDARKKGKLINCADIPELCDFYLGSVVTKGNLKLAVSTNGKSPTIAKRLKEVFAEMLPEEIDGLLENMEMIRKNLSGDFSTRVHQLNELTRSLVEKQKAAEDYEQYWFL